MSVLYTATWRMPAADLGPANPLPALAGRHPLQALGDAGGVPQAMLDSLAWGQPPSILPYTVQDGYDRQRRPRDFRVAVLENETLRATFLLELGGRLWSLFHKPSGRELLSVNPVFQPANLAIRNAWFSGGVEWNIGLIGHSPFTCEPLFAARVEGPGGTPVLRLYEWERVRGVPWQVDAYLPDGSPLLFVRVSIANPHAHDVPMYWWSNMAVPETPGTRVIAPAAEAWQFGYGRLDVVPVPLSGGVDVSYPTRIRDACDFFYRLPDGQRPWIAALDATGRGLAQVSTDGLRGRKLFVWGTNPGGRRWQEFLAVPGHAYLEIQAGLGRTQMEYVRMPAGARWAWLEAYGLLESDPERIHGPDWDAARHAVETGLEALIPRVALDAELARGGEFADRPPVEIIQRGAGWAALERRRRRAAGQPPFCSAGLVFNDASLTAEQVPWLQLLEDGAMAEPWLQAPSQALPPRASSVSARGLMVQDEWRSLLEDALRAAPGGNWLAWLCLGEARYYAGDHEGARQAWQRSSDDLATPWALRNRAVLAREAGDLALAAELYLAALQMQPTLTPLAAECGACLIEAGRPTLWLERLAELPPEVRRHGRICLLEARAALATGDLAAVERTLLAQPVVDDLREGETALSDIWFAFHERRLAAAGNVPVDAALRARVRKLHPLPAALDFRMQADIALPET